MEQYCWPMTIYDTGSCFIAKIVDIWQTVLFIAQI